MTQFKYKLIKVLMVCLELEPRAAGWKTQTNPLSYCGTPQEREMLHTAQTKWQPRLPMEIDFLTTTLASFCEGQLLF